MKNFKKLLVLFVFITFFCIFLAACNNDTTTPSDPIFEPETPSVPVDDDPTDDNPSPVILSAPVVKMNSTDVSWDAVSYAVSYLVDIDGMEYPIDTTSYSLVSFTEKKLYHIKVKAIGGGEDYLNSDWSDIKIYALLDTPVIFEYDEATKTVTWNDVTDSNLYRLYFMYEEDNGGPYYAEQFEADLPIGVRSYTLDDYFFKGEYYELAIKVMAKNSTANYNNADWSDKFNFTVGIKGLSFSSTIDSLSYELRAVYPNANKDLIDLFNN